MNLFFYAPWFRENWFSTAFIYRRLYAFSGSGQGFFWRLAPARRCCRFLSTRRPIPAGVPPQNRQTVGTPMHTAPAGASGASLLGAVDWVKVGKDLLAFFIEKSARFSDLMPDSQLPARSQMRKAR